ncbi:MAG: HAD family hydrolase [Deltaproteobacteria bacterium]|nr:HAD family hydrolase [Deltaproteobacteria bacterium]
MKTNDKKVISFDLDGTLVDPAYAMWVWERGIPRLYAQKNKLGFARAQAHVTAQYRLVGDTSLEWYDISYWFTFFGLPESWSDLMNAHRKRICLFPEVKEVIEYLVQRYELIVVSNAAQEFIDIEVKETGTARYFGRIFSATSDFGQVKRTPAFYQMLCEFMDISPSQMIHVGDHYEFDYRVPRRAGVEAYYLDRGGEGPKTIHALANLKEFVNRLS